MVDRDRDDLSSDTEDCEDLETDPGLTQAGDAVDSSAAPPAGTSASTGNDTGF